MGFNLMSVMSNDVVRVMLNRLNKLRMLDSMLDFARASTQLDILIALSDNKPASLDELASRVGRGKRQVADAIRKMLSKGFVRYEERDGEMLIVIDENGLEYLKGVSDILSINIKDAKVVLDSKKADVTENIGIYFYAYEALTILGVAQHPLSLNKLASIMNISPNRLESYLDLFISRDGVQNIFEKVYKISYRILSFRHVPRTSAYYKLSELGMKIFYKLPFYIKYKNSIKMRFLMRIMFTPHYRTAFDRFVKFYIFGTIVAFFMLLIPYGWIFAAVWLYFSILAFSILSMEF